ncbi:MAG: hypothetical protein HGA67_01455 [Candidatus Yonathbacteria bacterium]|nr:hypothetical protein [Candidatus Yonathbacteria bacterium]
MIQKPSLGSFLYIDARGKVVFSVFADKELPCMIEGCTSKYVIIVRICRLYDNAEKQIDEYPEVEIIRGKYTILFTAYLNSHHPGWKLKAA